MYFLLSTVGLTRGECWLQTGPPCPLCRLSPQPSLSHRALSASPNCSHCPALRGLFSPSWYLRHFLYWTRQMFRLALHKDCKSDLVCRLLFVKPYSRLPHNFLILLTVCSRLNCVPYKRWTQALTPRTSNMTLFGNRTIADVISNKALEFETLEKYFFYKRETQKNAIRQTAEPGVTQLQAKLILEARRSQSRLSSLRTSDFWRK